jgi:hypothetical protein
MLFFQFVVSTIDQDDSTNRPTRIHLIQNRARMMVQRNLVDIVTGIGIMWMARVRVESRRIRDSVEETTETSMNGCHRVKERVNPANSPVYFTRTVCYSH